jgi:hypothetical protein
MYKVSWFVVAFNIVMILYILLALCVLFVDIRVDRVEIWLAFWYIGIYGFLNLAISTFGVFAALLKSAA